MPTRNVVLTDHQSALVEELVRTGRYQNASEVLREGLRLVEQRKLQDEARLQALRAAVGEGLTELAAEQYVDIDVDDAREFIAQLGHRAPTRPSP